MRKADWRADHLSARRRTLENQVESGLIAGLVSSFPTALLLGLGGVFAGVGPVAPFYAIVSILSPGPLEIALSEVDSGAEVTFFQQPFVVGLAICLLLGAVSGVVFALGTRRHLIRGWVRYLLGAVHGVLMMCLFYLGALQVVGAVLDLEVETMSLSNLVGWPMLVLAHVAHGVVLAWIVRSRLTTTENVFARRAHRAHRQTPA